MAEDQKPADQAGQADQQTAGSQQDQAGASDDAQKTPGAQDTVSRAELDKVIGERQAAKDRARAVEQQLAEVQKNPMLQTDPKQWETFLDWTAKGAEAAKKKAIESGEVEKIEQGVREPMQKQIDALRGTLDARNGQLTALLKNQALKVAATAASAVSPDQVVGLLRDRVRMVEDAATGQFRAEYFDAEGQPMYGGDGQRVADADTFVRSFLSLPANSNLVRANTPPGSGAKPTGGPTSNTGGPLSVEQFNKLPAEQRAERASEMTSQQMEESLGIQQPGKKGFL